MIISAWPYIWVAEYGIEKYYIWVQNKIYGFKNVHIGKGQPSKAEYDFNKDSLKVQNPQIYNQSSKNLRVLD